MDLFYSKDFDKVMSILTAQGVKVFRAQIDPVMYQVEYILYSDKFLEQKEGHEIPTSRIVVEKNEDKIISVKIE